MRPDLVLFAWLALGQPFAKADRMAYQSWYPSYRANLTALIDGTCSPQYQLYLSDQNPCPQFKSCKESFIVNCLLSSVDQVMIANMASASVLLGLLPTILSLAGSSTFEMGLLALRRPFLALLLATGSPAVSPIRSFEYRDPGMILQRRPDSLGAPDLTPRVALCVSAIQYLLALTAIGNLIVVCWQLTVRTTCSFSMETSYLLMLWALLAVPVHMAGAVAVWLRLRLVTKSCPGQSTTLESLGREFCLSVKQPEAELGYRKESYTFLVMSWVTSTGTVLHIIFGTLVLSGTLFIATQDALSVAAQFLASTLLCRLVLMFELNGTKSRITVEGADYEPVALVAHSK